MIEKHFFALVYASVTCVTVARSASLVICQLWLLRPSTMRTWMRSFASELPLTRIPSKQVKKSDLKILNRFVYAKISFTT